MSPTISPSSSGVISVGRSTTRKSVAPTKLYCNRNITRILAPHTTSKPTPALAPRCWETVAKHRRKWNGIFLSFAWAMKDDNAFWRQHRQRQRSHDPHEDEQRVVQMDEIWNLLTLGHGLPPYDERRGQWSHFQDEGPINALKLKCVCPLL